MKYTNLIAVAVLAMSIGFVSACTDKRAQVPKADVQFADSNYKLSDKVSQQVCNTYIFGLDFSALFGTSTANVPRSGGGELPIPIVGGGSTVPEVGEAMYKSAKKMPKATHLIEPRTHVTTKGLTGGGHPIFGKRCGKVDALSVQIGKPYPYPNK